MSKLLIVESPTKVKTIKKYLGSDYEVMASKGHVRDLPQYKLGIDIDNDFKPMYTTIKGKSSLIKSLKDSASNCDEIYLATDPDREGEAISWHLAQLLGLDMNKANRVTFNEITKSGITEGMKSSRVIDIDLVDAQQARRVLDRLVGYKISPFLWKKVERGLSAGRVQSVAVKLIVDREREIRNFKPEEYWSIDAELKLKGTGSVVAAKFHGNQDGKLDIKNEEEANKILAELKGANYTVANVKKGVRRRKPAPPFITSTLQQEASRKLGFAAEETMSIAQNLYEGIEISGLGTTGLITYMRTDSLRISDEARAAGEKYITDRFGSEYLPTKPNVFKAKSNAQDAHEAIRPTMVELSPSRVKDDLNPRQLKLYTLIWSRYIASFMAPCVQDTMNVDIAAGNYIFKASGYTVRFDGFTAVYEESKDVDEESQKALPPLKNGDEFDLKSINGNQHFTQPPARYTDASLIKALEEKNIGRPSTYAPIISNITKKHGYVKKEKKNLIPTPIGEVVTEVMEQNFKDIVDVKFTAGMEKELDDVANGNLNWVEMIRNFYGGFDQTLKNAEKAMDGIKVKVPVIESDVVCEKCGRKMIVKSGRYGKFLACPGYPECKNTKPIVKETGGFCPKCGSKMLEKKSAKGYKYFGCENKECNFMTWDTPTDQKCPNCGKSLFKAKGGIMKCLDENCAYEIKIERKSRKKADTDAKENDEG